MSQGNCRYDLLDRLQRRVLGKSRQTVQQIPKQKLNGRLVAVFAAFILTFFFHLSTETRDGLHLSLGAHAEAVLSPEAAPATLSSVSEAPSVPLAPIDDLDMHEHDDHEIVVNDLDVEISEPQALISELSPKFHPQKVYIPFRRPPRS